MHTLEYISLGNGVCEMCNYISGFVALPFSCPTTKFVEISCCFFVAIYLSGALCARVPTLESMGPTVVDKSLGGVMCCRVPPHYCLCAPILVGMVADRNDATCA